MKLEEFLNCKHDIDCNSSLTRLYCLRCGQDANVIDYIKNLEQENAKLKKELEDLEFRFECFKKSPSYKAVELAQKGMDELNAQLREALEFYANTDNWLEEINRNNLYTVIKNDASDDYDDALRFGGKRARQALQGSKE